MQVEANAWVLGGVMVGTGSVGGLLSWLLQRGVSSDPDVQGDVPQRGEPVGLNRSLPSFLIEGTIAAAVVPLFLALTGSKLVDEVLGATRWGAGHFHFVGLCLVASLGASSFLEKVTSTALGGIRSALSQSAEAKRAATSAKEEFRKFFDVYLGAEGIELDENAQEAFELGDDARRLYQLMVSSPERRFFAERALRDGSKLGRATFEQALCELKEQGIVDSLNTQGVTAWYLTAKGRGADHPLRQEGRE